MRPVKGGVLETSTLETGGGDVCKRQSGKLSHDQEWKGLTLPVHYRRRGDFQVTADAERPADDCSSAGGSARGEAL